MRSLALVLLLSACAKTPAPPQPTSSPAPQTLPAQAPQPEPLAQPEPIAQPEPVAQASASAQPAPLAQTEPIAQPAPGAGASCGCAPADLTCSMRCSATKGQAPSSSRPGTRALDREAADAALSSAAAGARACARPGGPTGTGTVTVSFTPRGTVSRATPSAPFAGTAVGDCLSRIFEMLSVPSFDGPAEVSLTKSVSLR